MKKLFLLLLIAALSLFVLTGCDGLVPAEGEGEGEGEGETEGVVVEVDGMVELAGKNWIARGTHDITITFPSPVAGWVQGYITYCTGDYSKEKNGDGTEVIFFPNEDKTVWTGSGSFQDSASWCCASYLQIISGECEGEVCISIPVIVDSAAPYVKFKTIVSDEDCPCGGCTLTMTSLIEELACVPDVECCGDECSGLANWSVVMFNDYPWGECCSTECEEPFYTESGTGCPVDFTTPCLDPGIYYLILTMVDNVGNETIAGGGFELLEGCTIGSTEISVPEECDYDEVYFCGFDSDMNPIQYIDPDWTMDDSCYASCEQSG